MADDFLTVADFVADALDVDRTQTSEVLNAAPFIARLPLTDTSDGSSTHKYNKYTGAPVVGFRAENAGREYDHSIDTVVTVTCKILDFSWKADKAVADSWRDGPEALIAREGLRHLGAALFKLEQQNIYGTTAPGDAAGYDGFLDNTDLDALADDMVISATGSTVAEQSSVYAVRAGFDDVRMVTPFAQGLQLGDTQVIESLDGSSLAYPAYYTPATMFIGFQMGGKYSVGRVANIHGSDSGAALDDDNLSALLGLFPAGMGPDFFLMNRAARQQLQQSRTATNMTGAPAPFPDSAFGVPIITTDAITSTEAVEV